MKSRVQATGAPVAREHRDGGQIKTSTFIPLKIRKRGASKVVARPDGQVEAADKVTMQYDPAPAGGVDPGVLLAAAARRRRGGQRQRDRPTRRPAPPR